MINNNILEHNFQSFEINNDATTNVHEEEIPKSIIQTINFIRDEINNKGNSRKQRQDKKKGGKNKLF
jgi:hypothetical protein